MMPASLQQLISSGFQVNPEELLKLESFFKPMELKKQDFFLKERQFAAYMGFIQSGLIREYFEHDGRQITKWISGPGYFVAELSSFLFGKPARVNIQAMSDVELFVISKTDYARISASIPRWPEIEKTFIARCFTVLEDRIMSHLALDAEARFEAFFQYNPALFNEAPAHYLASMLGMTAETFSRIRKKRSKRTS